jgi:Zn-finger nucleic acid-binding protein
LAAAVDMCKFFKGLWLDAGELKEIEAVRQNLQQEKTGKICRNSWNQEQVNSFY